nr:YlxR family protein [Angustibacter sp. Root456]
MSSGVVGGAAHEPQRRCVGCRRSGRRSVLLRFAVVERDGARTVVLDERRILPGRGAWLHPDLECWELATRRSALLRALRTTARIEQDGITSALQALCTVNEPAPDPGSGDSTSASPSARARSTGSGSER